MGESLNSRVGHISSISKHLRLLAAIHAFLRLPRVVGGNVSASSCCTCCCVAIILVCATKPGDCRRIENAILIPFLPFCHSPGTFDMLTYPLFCLRNSPSLVRYRSLLSSITLCTYEKFQGHMPCSAQVPRFENELLSVL